MKSTLALFLEITGSILFIGLAVDRLLSQLAHSRRIPKIFKGLLALCLAAGIAVAGYCIYRNRQMDQLFEQAINPRFFRSSDQSGEAVRELATYRGKRAAQMLIYIATSDSPLLNFGSARSNAIDALGKRNDPDAASALANSLQQNEDLDTQQEAANALKGLPCNAQCIASIFHYLDGCWRGETKNGDQPIDTLESNEAIARRQKEQQTIYLSLYSVLDREKVATLRNLVQNYGLGNSNPSPFGLNMVSRLGLSDACPYLEQSERNLQNVPPELYKAMHNEIQAAIVTLKCPQFH